MNAPSVLPAVPLGDLIGITSGFAFKSERFGEAGEIPVVRIRDVKRGYSETFYSGEYDEQYLVNDGDLLIGMDGEFNRERWRGGKALLNQRVCKLVVYEKQLSGDYLYYFLPEALKEIEDRTPFATVKHLSVKDIKSIEIPLPSLDEQRRIAVMLDKADDLRRKRKRAIELIDNLGHSIFRRMFVGQQSEAWPKYTVASLARNIRTGPFGSQLLHSEFVDAGIAVLGIDNAVANEFRWGERRYISNEKYAQLRRYTVSPGDVLITIMGTCGRCAIVPDDGPVAINTKHLCCITLDRDKCLPKFLQATFLQHPDVLQQLGVQAKGAVMPGLNMGIIKSLSISVPPIDLQRTFSETISNLRTMLASSRLAEINITNLFSSLQHRAFSGQL